MSLESETAKRLERLIAAQEAQTNAITRLVQALESRGKRREKSGRTRAKRLVLDKPMEVTPLVQASVERALRRVGLK